MAETFYDSSADPFNSDAFSYYHLQSTGYSGSWDPITCPAATNYPVSGVANRLFVSLPMRVDQSDLSGTRPIALKIGATTLTRVTAAPGANEYRLCTSTSERTDIIELNATRIGATLDFDYYGTGSIINGSDMNNIKATTVTTTGAIISGGALSGDTVAETNGFVAVYRDMAGTETTMGIHHKIVEIGTWNMDTTDQKAVNPNITNTKILFISAMIIPDAGVISVPIDRVGDAADPGLIAGNVYVNNATTIILLRRTGGFFDSASYSSAIINRGYLYIVYMD